MTTSEAMVDHRRQEGVSAKLQLCIEKGREEEVGEVIEPHHGIDVYIGYIFVHGAFTVVHHCLNMYFIYWLE